MKTVTLQDAVTGMESMKQRDTTSNLFTGESETLENFTKSDYYYYKLIDSQSTEAQSYEVRGSSLRETILAITNEGIAQLINVQQTSYNGEAQAKISSKDLTLQGFNYFSKELEIEPFIGYYEEQLAEAGYDLTYADVLEIGVYLPQYNCTTLSFEANGYKHWITINKLGQLSKLTKKPLASKVQPNQVKQEVVIKSILG